METGFRQPREITPRRRFMPLFGLLLIGILIVVGFFTHANTPHPEFPVGDRIDIPEGSSLMYIAAMLDEQHVIRNAFLFRSIISFFGAESDLHAGAHIFNQPMTTYAVARSFIEQTSGAPAIRVTIPEGTTLKKFDAILSAALPSVQEGEIFTAAEGKEGILFPDTYFFREDINAGEVVKMLEENQAAKLAPLKADIDAHTLSEAEIITLASLLEGEANDETSMRTVSGILQERLRIGMALQVDATFTYLLGKESKELLPEDLEIDSPYNTYLYPGLPPGPIGSPGLMAIQAVLDPLKTDYLYYLTDAEGNFHYAETFDEHKENKARYLR